MIPNLVAIIFRLTFKGKDLDDRLQHHSRIDHIDYLGVNFWCPRGSRDFLHEWKRKRESGIRVCSKQAIRDYVRRVPKADRKMEVETPQHRLRWDASAVCFCGLEMEAVKQCRCYDYPSSCNVCKVVIVGDDLMYTWPDHAYDKCVECIWSDFSSLIFGDDFQRK